MRLSRIVTGARAALVAGCVAAVAGLAMTSSSIASDRHLKVGVLTCAAGPSIGLLITSNERINCSFQPDTVATEHYSGHIRKFGLDVGITAGSVIIWAVFASQSDYVPGSLAGEYIGVSAEETTLLGLGANVLVGGSQDSIVLQPLSVQAQAGLNLAVGVSRMVLNERDN
ncbi:DUF992 domain-containing protein [Bauldia sp.]|uniref:DUF992 domain-containing protein n=1 Tax=Bauldia sp. TaxID=2575872 RepID=UPI003BA9A96F